MSSDVEIRSGGAVAVDTAALRDAATSLEATSASLTAIATTLIDVAVRVEMLASYYPEAYVARCHAERATDAATTATSLALSLRATAAAYEIVELRAQRELAIGAGNRVEQDRLDAEISRIAAEYPEASWTATIAWWQWSAGRSNELMWQGLGAAAPFGPGAMSLAVVLPWLMASSPQGVIGRDARLAGPADPVVLSRVSAPLARTVMPQAPVRAPTGLADLAARVPGDGAARVRTERYTMPNGTQRYAVYVTGTKSWSLTNDEPWNLDANIDLYAGARSDSYDATVAALTDAGAEAGDTVYVIGHSQGAMIASNLALNEQFDTGAVVTFGSPVEAAVGPDTLSIQVRHDDDPISALAAGGSVAPVGAQGSFVAHRVADPQPGLADLALPAHHMSAYEQTAALLDASSDPRMQPVRSILDSLGDATSVEVREYGATQAQRDAD